MSMLTNNLALPARLRPEAATCSSHHALSYRLPSGKAVQDRLDRIDAAFRAQGELAPRIEIDSYAFASGSPQAELIRRRELAILPPGGARSGMRGHVLAWADGVSDLILVGRRDPANGDALGRMIGVSGTPPAPGPRALIDDLPLPEGEWGLGGDAPREGRCRLDQPQWAVELEFSRQVAAIALALSRFENKRRIVLGVFAHPAFPAEVTGACAGHVRLVGIDLARTAGVRELVEAVARQLAEGPVVDPDTAAGLGLVGVTGPALHVLPDGALYQAHVQPPFVFTLGISPGAGECWADVDTRRFSPDMARTFVRVAGGMARHLESLLAEAPDSAADVIPWVDAGHAAEVVALGRSRPLPMAAKPERIDEAIARHAASQPERIAVTCDGKHMDYRSLHDLAGRIATVLGELGVGEGDFVGILVERQLELVPVLLGVLRAGAAYVPIDPAYPQDRINFTLDDAAPALVVCGSSQSAADGPARIGIDELLARAATAAPRTRPVQAGAEGDAYVIYTSGSTGRPKGVLVPHKNVAALIEATREDFELGPADTWTLFHSTAFDFSVWEIWACLATGARLVVVPYLVTRSPESFQALLAAEGVTVLNQTPSAFTQLVELECQTGAPPLALRLVIFGGEPLDCRPLTRWFDRYPESVCRLVNMFGITETTVHVTAETITRAHALAHSRAVGPAIPGWHLCVLDEALRLVPPGVVGEIHVTGAGVAKEYLHRGDLTAQRFIPDALTGTGGKMYRSGDRGRLRHDGRLEHLGRIDSQVKIRGFRIELDEIRAVLLEYPGVSGAAVLVNRADPDDAATARLDAYVVLPEADLDAIRRHLERTLPVHMVPATITPVPALPLTANGKLDAGRLPAPQRRPGAAAAQPAASPAQGAAAPEAATASASALETELLEIWSELLGTPVGLDDNFFELGGNSLYAVRLSAAMRKRKLPPMPSRDLYIHQTVRRIAQTMTAASAGAGQALAQ